MDASLKNKQLSKNIMTVVFDFVGTSEWLRLRLVCKNFNEAAYSMKNYKLQSVQEAVKKQ